jgi:hypothetical protein
LEATYDRNEKRIVKMAVMKNMSVIVAAAMLAGCATDPAAVKPAAMFNGKDLTGWYTYIKGKGVGNDPDRVFTVNAEGNLLISGDGFGYIATEREYSDYRLSLEYRWCGRAYGPRIGRPADSGLLFHAIGEDGAMHHGAWMKSFEYNIIVGRTGDLIVIGEPGKDDITAKAKVNEIGRWNPDGKEKVIIGSGRVDNRFNPPNLPGDDTRPVTPPESPYGEWNRLELVCSGDRAEYYLNGVKVNELYGLKPTRGKILLQTEGHGIEYRNVRITSIP